MQDTIFALSNTNSFRQGWEILLFYVVILEDY